MAPSAEQYDAWYATPRGRWIAGREWALLARLLPLKPQATVLDVGTGTGHFARRFAGIGLQVTGLDPEPAALAYAAAKSADIRYVQGDAQRLPFADLSFDYCAAVTSLCFIADAKAAVHEMWRVARCGVVLGLLHRHSLLHRQKAGQGAYAGARWDDAAAVEGWLAYLTPAPAVVRTGYAVFFPGAARAARLIEPWLPVSWPYGAFLAVALERR
ncbi:MAG: class I SAM-dependent methyltransferase [Gammaproteobacteria bacterium]|nr:class I SAM-dependent methyltransferase [Gammaproteobacteria bacterium]